MKILLSAAGVVCAAFLLLAFGRNESRAQAAAEIPPVNAADPAALSQADLFRSYWQMQEQLQALQLELANNRIESEAAARAQTAAVTQKLDSLRSIIEAEREQQRVEALRASADRDREQAAIQRLSAERERHQAEVQRWNKMVLWIAAGFGGLGLIAMIFVPFFLWRTINRVTPAMAPLSPLPVSAAPTLLPGDPAAASTQAVTLSNQRLMAVIERMERRIFELEHTAALPAPLLPAKSASGSAPNGTPAKVSSSRRGAVPAGDPANWIGALLNKGRSLLSTNKPMEAVACYDEILKLDSKHAEALVRKGVALERLDRYEEAIQCYERAIESDQKMTFAYLSKGGVCNRLGRFDEALQCYEQALEAEEKGS